jgi:hypothetical protein
MGVLIRCLGLVLRYIVCGVNVYSVAVEHNRIYVYFGADAYLGWLLVILIGAIR